MAGGMFAGEVPGWLRGNLWLRHKIIWKVSCSDLYFVYENTCLENIYVKTWRVMQFLKQKSEQSKCKHVICSDNLITLKPFKPGKDNYYVISRYSDLRNLRHCIVTITTLYQCVDQQPAWWIISSKQWWFLDRTLYRDNGINKSNIQWTFLIDFTALHFQWLQLDLYERRLDIK